MNAITEKVNEYFNFADEVRAERIARQKQSEQVMQEW